MSMHKLTAGDGYAYLTRHVAAGDAGLDAGASLTGYYEQTGNPPGRWYGSGLGGLGSEAIGRATPGDVVTEPAMAAVFRDGHDPVTGAALGRPYPRFDTTERRAVVGYDLTFTAPKSVSVLWALADDATRATVYEAHRAALASTLDFVERGGEGRTMGIVDRRAGGVIGQRPQDRDGLRGREGQVVADDGAALRRVEAWVRATERSAGHRVVAIAEDGRHRRLGDNVARRDAAHRLAAQPGEA